jgi:hypothetical protein
MNGKYYSQVLRGQLSEDDNMAVVLTVKDWQAIAENLHEDADAEGYGPAQSYFIERGEVTSMADVPILDYQNAYDKDAQDCAAHSCAAATDRCADVIDETLKQNGWSG